MRRSRPRRAGVVHEHGPWRGEPAGGARLWAAGAEQYGHGDELDVYRLARRRKRGRRTGIGRNVSAGSKVSQVGRSAGADDLRDSFTVYRNGQFLLQNQSSTFTDATVLPSTSYTYVIWPTDYHNNTGGSTTITVATPAAGMIDPREPGVKSSGSHWGAMGEQINCSRGI